LTQIKKSLARYKCPKDVHFIEALAPNTMGKVQISELPKRY